MLNIFFITNILFFFALNVINAQEFDSDLILAKKNMSAGNLTEAELILSRVLKIDPSYAPAYVVFSKLWMLKADMRKASENANFAVKIDEDLRPWWNELNEISNTIQIGIKHVKKQKYELAGKIFSGLIKKYPAYPEMYYYMGMAQYKQKNYKEALGNFNKAVDLYPNYSKAHKALVNVKKRFKK
tara:strand:+ start:396 stop:950 length:555 start_codon:yes stop_codon:yes gene_type:complete